MKRIGHIFIVCIFFIVVSLAKSANPPPEKYNLTETEFNQLRAKALSGDAKAASRIYDYYDLIKRDRINSMFWMQLAAELGSCKDMHSLMMNRVTASRYSQDLKTENLADAKRLAGNIVMKPCGEKIKKRAQQVLSMSLESR
jgi:hypothetical protein